MTFIVKLFESVKGLYWHPVYRSRLGHKGVNFGVCVSALGVSYMMSNDEAVFIYSSDDLEKNCV